MTIEKARKVIGLNIHNLDEKMQMAVATIMDAVEKKAAWKPSEEQMEALMLAIEGKCPPTSYMSRRLEDLYEGLVNTYDIQENYLNNAGYSNHEQPSEDLEEEIKRYILRDQCPVPDLMEAVARHFAEWQKEQMMEDALEGYIAQRINGELYAKCHIPKAMNFEFGDKIKIIIIGRANDAD